MDFPADHTFRNTILYWELYCFWLSSLFKSANIHSTQYWQRLISFNNSNGVVNSVDVIHSASTFQQWSTLPYRGLYLQRKDDCILFKKYDFFAWHRGCGSNVLFRFIDASRLVFSIGVGIGIKSKAIQDTFDCSLVFKNSTCSDQFWFISTGVLHEAYNFIFYLSKRNTFFSDNVLACIFSIHS
jgi:hypothetical protein